MSTNFLLFLVEGMASGKQVSNLFLNPDSSLFTVIHVDILKRQHWLYAGFIFATKRKTQWPMSQMILPDLYFYVDVNLLKFLYTIKYS